MRVFFFSLFFLFATTGHGLCEIGLASWYSVEACRKNPDPHCPTASGESLYELERRKVFFGASWKFGIGEKVLVRNLKTGQEVEVVILDRGPAKRFKKRIIDLGKFAFSEIGDLKKGLLWVSVERKKD